jgi:hypothetical protein
MRGYMCSIRREVLDLVGRSWKTGMGSVAGAGEQERGRWEAGRVSTPAMGATEGDAKGVEWVAVEIT